MLSFLAGPALWPQLLLSEPAHLDLQETASDGHWKRMAVRVFRTILRGKKAEASVHGHNKRAPCIQRTAGADLLFKNTWYA